MYNFTSFQLAAIFLTLVLVEGRMVTRWEQREGVVNDGQAGKLMSRVEVEGEENANKRVVRQTGEDGGEAGPFDLFGQVLNSFGKKETGGMGGKVKSVRNWFLFRGAPWPVGICGWGIHQ